MFTGGFHFSFHDTDLGEVVTKCVISLFSVVHL